MNGLALKKDLLSIFNHWKCIDGDEKTTGYIQFMIVKTIKNCVPVNISRERITPDFPSYTALYCPTHMCL